MRTILDRPVPAFEVSTAKRPDVSVVVVTRDNLPFLRLCLETVLAHTGRPCELIVVDNGSTDGTAAYLERLAERNPSVRVITNDENRGFATACNQGAAMATADVLVLLNDDTVVCDDWLEPLLAHLARPAGGDGGPEHEPDRQRGPDRRRVPDLGRARPLRRGALARARGRGVRDRDPDDVLRRDAPRRCTSRSGRSTSASRPGCSRTTTTRVGCARPATACSARTTPSCITSARPPSGSSPPAASTPGCSRQTAPGSRRSGRSRGDPTTAARAIATWSWSSGCVSRWRHAIPADATVLVVSRGDEELLRLDGRRAWHFPRSDDGGYAGHHPADSDEAIARLEEQRAAGAEYIVFPATAAWWLDHYEGFRRHLDGNYERKLSDPETCFVFDLRERVR